MLSELTVRGFGIIEEIVWRPAEGLNVITGETGAGKSLVVDAVEALLSAQINEEDIRHGCEEACIECIFIMPPAVSAISEQLGAFLEEKGLMPEEDGLLLSCNFRWQGRSTPRVSRQAISRALMRDIGGFLVDIHGQSGHLSLLDRDRHLDFLDAYARVRDLRLSVAAKVAELSQAEREMQALARSEHDISRQAELLGFQIDEIRRADLREGEEEELQQELRVLSSAEKLKEVSSEAYRLLRGEGSTLESSSAAEMLAEAMPLLRQISETDPSMQEKAGLLEGMLDGLEELARDIRRYGDDLDYDPALIEEVQSRLELIRNLKRKYGNSIGEILDHLLKAEKELGGLTHSRERLTELEIIIERLKTETGTIASQLSQKRTRAAQDLASAAKKECADLAMNHVAFEVSVVREESPDGVTFPDGRRYRCGASGADVVEFMASTNPGEPIKPLAKIASTGEISRFMLALKSAMAGADMVPVLIFDEIDIGVGGRSGEVIGKKLWRLSRDHQVICVTHLPQIAAFADAHFSVSKASAGDRTTSSIKELTPEARLHELAVMIAGPRVTETALKTATELVQKAEASKKEMF